MSIKNLLPETPPPEVLKAMYQAWDFYGKKQGFFGTPEATRIYKAIREKLMERTK